MTGAGWGGLPSWLVESVEDWQDPTRRPWRDSEPVLCGECSDSLDDWAEWADAVQDIPAGDRIPCDRCGQ